MPLRCLRVKVKVKVIRPEARIKETRPVVKKQLLGHLTLALRCLKVGR